MLRIVNKTCGIAYNITSGTSYIIPYLFLNVNVFIKLFSLFLKKGLTFGFYGDIIDKQCVGTHGRICRNGGIGRRPGLKIP